MDPERKDHYDVAKTQEKNSEDLDSYKKMLKKELDSIRTLVNTDTTENNATNSSNITSEIVISPAEYEKLKEENRTLRFENESLNSANSMLENDNKLLRENVERLKLGNSNSTELEYEVSKLKEVILNLEKEKLALKTMETPKFPVQETIYKQDVPVDISNDIKSMFDDKESTETSTSPVHRGYTVPPIKSKKFRRKTIPKPEEIIAEDTNSIPVEDSTIPYELDSEKIIKETVRRKCPTCLNTSKKYIREFTDKTNVLMQYPRIYGKKFKCGICTTEWK